MMGMQQPSHNQQSQQQQKHDIFVGNLAFSTTEEQLHQAFSEIGRIIKVRMVSDLDTGKPRGFAFIEFEDPQAALSAIRNMNDYELNGRRIRVNFSNSSHLEALAGKLGMDMSSRSSNMNSNNNAVTGNDPMSSNNSSKNNNKGGLSSGSISVADSILGLSKGEMYNIIAQLKQVAEKDPDEARKVLSGHPQLPEAILHLMSKLEMIKTPLNEDGSLAIAAPGLGGGAMGGNNLYGAPPPMSQPGGGDPRAALINDPRAAAAAARRDPRAALANNDPRGNQSGPPPHTQHLLPPPPPYQQQQQYSVPPPPSLGGGTSGTTLDPNLAKQVMALTPQQIAQLPHDKQQSILTLRNQIASGQI